MTPIGSLVRVHFVEVGARVGPFFVTALRGAAAAASRDARIAARSTPLMWARFHTHLAQDGEEASMRLAP
jgi:hypothetical protein